MFLHRYVVIYGYYLLYLRNISNIDYIEEEAMIQTFDAFLWNADLLQIATTILRARNQSLTKR